MMCSYRLSKLTLYALLPLLWGSLISLQGCFVTLLGFYHPLFAQVGVLLRVSVMLFIIFFLLGRRLTYCSTQIDVYCFGYKLWLPSLRVLILLLYVALFASFFFVPLWDYPVVQSLIQGCLVSGFIEELVTRFFLINRDLSVKEFAWLNVVSAISFAVMHSFYGSNDSLFSLLVGGHIQFSMLMSFLTFKVQRIELTMILHAMFNMRYALCSLIFCIPQVGALIFTGCMMLVITMIVGCSYVVKREASIV